MPGLLTLKNLLTTALEPVGTALYVYGGGWNLQDTGAGPQAVHIGLSETWLDWFSEQDESYDYRLVKGIGENPYYYAGLDCSGYLGWVVYNILHTENGGEGYVFPSSKLARTLAERYGLGSWTTSTYAIKPGDIVSIPGHVWICLGNCPDGSMVILHSTPSPSRVGTPGGGVQLTGIGDISCCQGVQLARAYMSRFYPDWSQRYEAVFRPKEVYLSQAECFSWDLESVLTDPDGYRYLCAAEILRNLFER